MRLLAIVFTMIVAFVGALISVSDAAENKVGIRTVGDQICMGSDGMPNHETGTFPNRGNPHSIKEQNFYLCVPANPVKKETPSEARGAIGFAINGVLIRPGTADFYDASSPRGHSRDPRSGWRLDGMGSADALGMDEHNAHVDNQGIYHYHGVPTGLVNVLEGSQIGYAADGFTIHYMGDQVKSGYTLKKGVRPSAPGGKYDGSYVQDWEYTGGEGTLDRCNGGDLNGQYVYFVTKTYPHYPPCLWGEVSKDFRMMPERRGDHGEHPPHHHGHPPHHRH